MHVHVKDNIFKIQYPSVKGGHYESVFLSKSKMIETVTFQMIDSDTDGDSDTDSNYDFPSMAEPLPWLPFFLLTGMGRDV